VAKQHLSPETAIRPGGVLTVADDLVGLHATAAETPYLSLYARMTGPVMEELDDELYQRRTLVRLKAVRGTVFLMPRRLAPIAFAATREMTIERDRRWLRLDTQSYARTAPAVLDALVDRSLTVAELRRSVQEGADLTAVVALLCDEGLIVRDRPTGSRKSSTFRYRRWDQTYPDVDLAAYQPEEAIRLLVREYIDRYGPVSMADILWWTGLPARSIRAAVTSLASELTTSTLPGISDELFTLDADEVSPSQTIDKAPSVRLLPQLDPYTMGYHDRSRLADSAHYELIYDRGGNATSVVLVDGRVAGVWDLTETPKSMVRLLVFDSDSPHRHRALDRAAAAGQFWFGHEVPVQEYTEMVPPRQRTGVMRKPLDGARLRQEPARNALRSKAQIGRKED